MFLIILLLIFWLSFAALGALLCGYAFWECLIRKQAPFVPVSREILPAIIKELDIKNKSLVYDLGCGDGRVVLAGAKAFPQAQFVGLEKNPLPYCLARLNVFTSSQSVRVKILKRNFFKTDLSSATRLFLYLLPEQNEKLFSKLQKELKPGTKVVSCDFAFKNKTSQKIIDLSAEARFGALKHKLYVYQF